MPLYAAIRFSKVRKKLYVIIQWKEGLRRSRRQQANGMTGILRGDLNMADQTKSEDPRELFGMYLAHVGINAENEDDVERIVGDFERLMGLARMEIAPASLFASDYIEVMRPGRGRGTKGHIGFHVDDIAAAEKWFEARGFKINESSRVLKDGKTFLVYFQEEIAGFAIHLTVQK